jgi:hypothetical protein
MYRLAAALSTVVFFRSSWVHTDGRSAVGRSSAPDFSHSIGKDDVMERTGHPNLGVAFKPWCSCGVKSNTARWVRSSRTQRLGTRQGFPQGSGQGVGNQINQQFFRLNRLDTLSATAFPPVIGIEL